MDIMIGLGCILQLLFFVFEKIAYELCDNPDVDAVADQPILRLGADVWGPMKCRPSIRRRRREVKDSKQLCWREITYAKSAKVVYGTRVVWVFRMLSKCCACLLRVLGRESLCSVAEQLTFRSSLV